AEDDRDGNHKRCPKHGRHRNWVGKGDGAMPSDLVAQLRERLSYDGLTDAGPSLGGRPPGRGTLRWRIEQATGRRRHCFATATAKIGYHPRLAAFVVGGRRGSLELEASGWGGLGHRVGWARVQPDSRPGALSSRLCWTSA